MKAECPNCGNVLHLIPLIGKFYCLGCGETYDYGEIVKVTWE